MNNLIYLVCLIAWIWSLYDIWTSKKDQGKKLLWTIIVLVLPVIGTIIYLVAGRK
jgi:hypothetical protein